VKCEFLTGLQLKACQSRWDCDSVCLKCR